MWDHWSNFWDIKFLYFSQNSFLRISQLPPKMLLFTYLKYAKYIKFLWIFTFVRVLLQKKVSDKKEIRITRYEYKNWHPLMTLLNLSVQNNIWFQMLNFVWNLKPWLNVFLKLFWIFILVFMAMNLLQS